MCLKDRQTLWGVNISQLRNSSKRYRFGMTLMYLVDISVVIFLTAYLFYNDYSYSAYGYVVVCTALVVTLVAWQYINPAQWIAMRFFEKHKSLKIDEQSYSVDPEKLHSVLYCTGYHRMSVGGSIDRYKEMMLNMCFDNPKKAKVLIKYLEPYKDDNGNFTCYIAGGKYFVDIKEDNEDGISSCDGDVEDDDSGSADQRSSDDQGVRDQENKVE